ncbi:MAG: hypothetical protein GC154_03210 [bacterium]|nr:hypothetical protein [bacterium]
MKSNWMPTLALCLTLIAPAAALGQNASPAQAAEPANLQVEQLKALQDQMRQLMDELKSRQSDMTELKKEIEQERAKQADKSADLQGLGDTVKRLQEALMNQDALGGVIRKAQTLSPFGLTQPVPEQNAIPGSPPRNYYGHIANNIGDKDVIVKVIKLQHAPADMMVEPIRMIFGDTLMVIPHPSSSDQLILSGKQEQIEKVEQILPSLDVAPGKSNLDAPPVANLALRVFAVESGNKGNEEEVYVTNSDARTEIDFQLELSSPNDRADSASALPMDGIKVLTNTLRSAGDRVITTIQGRAASEDAINQYIEMYKTALQAVVVSLNTTARDVSRVQQGSRSSDYPNVPIPAEVSGIVNQLLGESNHVAGYWFGNASMPGSCLVPLGDWSLRLQTDSQPNDEFQMEITLSQGGRDASADSVPRMGMMMGSSSSSSGISNSAGWSSGGGGYGGGAMQAPPSSGFVWKPYGSEDNNVILQNSVKGRIGRPIIVGYNRPGGVLGALVIIPESEFAANGEGKKASVLFREDAEQIQKN